MFWWAWRLFADDGDGVDAKDICPSPSQICLDGFKFVDCVGFNRGGDPVFVLYVLAIFPVLHPSRIVKILISYSDPISSSI
jgi:hypothetical protein